jgi:F-type H+-transporting ATPase subunit epsilon
MDVDLVSAERRLYSGESSAVFARSVEGQIGILPGHQPLLLALDPAPLAIETDEGRKVFAVHGGFLEYRDGHLTILADGADLPDEIDRGSIDSDIQQAEQELAESEDNPRASRKLAIAKMRQRMVDEGM